MADKPFAVTHATWVKTEGDRIQGFILMPRFWGTKWDHKKLMRALADIGLNYSMAEIAELNDELHRRGIVEDVAEATPVAAEATDVV